MKILGKVHKKAFGGKFGLEKSRKNQSLILYRRKRTKDTCINDSLNNSTITCPWTIVQAKLQGQMGNIVRLG